MNNENDILFQKLLGRQMKEHVTLPEIKDQNEKKMSVEQNFLSPHSTNGSRENEKRWSFDFNMWHSVASVGVSPKLKDDIENETVLLTHSHQHLRTEVDLVYNLLSVTSDKEELAKTFLALSSSPESCATIRQSGCMPLLVQLIHNPEESKLVRQRAHQALHHIVRYHPDDKQGRREMRVLKLIEYLMEYCNDDRQSENTDNRLNGVEVGNSVDKKTQDDHPGSIIAALMKLSFDEEHRHAMCQLGALQVIAKLIEKDHQLHNSEGDEIQPDCVTLRRYAGMSLTNLTFGDSRNKALLCSLEPFMCILISQLNSPNEDLCQVTASVLRNLSWRADTVSKQTLRELGAVTALMNAALRVKNESTLKAVLSALWNFSAHCNLNKIDICNVNGAIEYLVTMLTYQAPSKTLLIVESVGGILRNISSIVAMRDDYREILRQNNCLQILVNQLKSPSLTVVSNACGTLWNLSARNVTDQRTLWQLGAVPMLRSLTHSKHKMISIGSSAALKNLLSSRPECDYTDRGSKGLPSLLVRKRRALEQELDPSLSETCDNIEQVESWDSFTTSFSSSCHSSSDNNNNNQNSNSPDSVSNAKLELPDSIGQCRPSSGIIVADNENSTLADNRIFDKIPSSSLETGDLKIGDNNNNNDYRKQLTTTKELVQDEEESYDGDYAETDLDQPTNYSLKYTEQQHDTVKTYYTEGTPHTFSTSNSMSDLRQVMINNSEVPDTPPAKEDPNRRKDEPEIITNTTRTATTINKESPTIKTVTFDTPMMFSRSSSLGSLSSYEQPDDRSSVVSDFSRLASGMISPSELPDSPSQTVPPSPGPSIKQQRPNSESDTKGELSCSAKTNLISDDDENNNNNNNNDNNIFDDSLKIFKDENTPLHFSTATSLSSLTFDDDANNNRNRNNLGTVDELSSEDVTILQQQEQRLSTSDASETRKEISSVTDSNNLLEDDNLLPESVIIGDDEDLSLEEQRAMLDACIKSGISKSTEKSKNRQQFRPFENDKILPNNNNNNIKNNNVVISKLNNRTNKNEFTTKCARYSPTGSINNDADSTVNFCTEDTPANISHAASNSDLSLLCPSEDSFLQDGAILPLLSCSNDDVELPLDEQKKLLNECIKAGLKTLNTTTTNTNNNNISSNSSLTIVEQNGCFKRKSSKEQPDDDDNRTGITDDLPVNEQKSLLKKCILAGINNVTTANSSLLSPSLSNSDDKTIAVNTVDLLAEDEQKSLLKQCIAMGIRNIKDATSCELENIGPPSFLAEANLENSLTNVDSIVSEIATESPTLSSVIEDVTIVEDGLLLEDEFQIKDELASVLNRERHTPKQKRRQIKDRYTTYTINTNQDEALESNRQSVINQIDAIKAIVEKPRKSFMIRERRASNRDRFKTRTLNEGDFNDLTAYDSDKNINNNNNNNSFDYEEEELIPITRTSSTVSSSISSTCSVFRQKLLPVETETIAIGSNGNLNSTDCENANEDTEEPAEQTVVKAKVVKPLVIKINDNAGPKVKTSSSIPIVNKPKTTASSHVRPLSTPAANKSKIPTKLPTPLQRQGTFTKDDTLIMPAPLRSPAKKSTVATRLFNGDATNNSSSSNNNLSNINNKQDYVNKNGMVKNCRIRSSYCGHSAAIDVRNRWSISDNSINTVSSLKNRSNSNLHLAASNSSTKSATTTPTAPATVVSQQPKKEVGSKIAGLWKKNKTPK